MSTETLLTDEEISHIGREAALEELPGEDGFMRRVVIKAVRKCLALEATLRAGRCQANGCGARAVFEIFDTNEQRPDHCGTLACQDHLGSLVGSVPPTEPEGPWTVYNYPYVAAQARVKAQPKVQAKVQAKRKVQPKPKAKAKVQAKRKR
jgi:hypothetical protein